MQSDDIANVQSNELQHEKTLDRLAKIFRASSFIKNKLNKNIESEIARKTT